MRSEWRSVRAADVIDFNPTLRLPKGSCAPKVAMEKLLPFTKRIDGFTMEPYSGGAKFCNGDTIMARITPCLENGKTAFVDILKDDEIGYGSTEYIVLRAKAGITDPQYVYYLATSPDFRRVAIKSMVGSSGRQRVQQSVLDEMIVLLPPLPEQVEIGRYLSMLDDQIALNNRINDNLYQQAMALFAETFLINPSEGEPMPLYDFADYINGAAFKPADYSEDGLPIIKIAELKNGITDSTQRYNGDKGEKYIIHDKDILFSWSGNPDTSIDIFIWCGGKAILNQHTFNVKSKEGMRWFIYLMLKFFKPQFSQIASNKQTTGLGHVTAADLKRLTFPYEREQILSFEEAVSPFMESIYYNMLENRKLASLRDALLPRLMSGEIDVSSITL